MKKTNWKPLHILFIGDEPSSKNKSPDVPFVGTPSYKRLLRWIGELDLEISNVRVTNSATTIVAAPNELVVFLGKSARKKTEELYSTVTIIENGGIFEGRQKVKEITIDHPSPRNRNFNKPGYEAKMLKDLKRWLYD